MYYSVYQYCFNILILSMKSRVIHLIPMCIWDSSGLSLKVPYLEDLPRLDKQGWFTILTTKATVISKLQIARSKTTTKKKTRSMANKPIAEVKCDTKYLIHKKAGKESRRNKEQIL